MAIAEIREPRPEVPDPAEAPAPVPARLCVAANLTESGAYGRRWLLLRDGEVRVYGAAGAWPEALPPRAAADRDAAWDGEHLLLDAVPPQEADLLHVLPLADVKSARVEPQVGAAALVAETKAGPVPLVRFTPTLSPDFGLAARLITAAAKGEPANIDPRQIPRHCPRCGRRLEQDTKVCPACTDRGAVLKRILLYAWPYRFRMAAIAGLMIIGVGLGLVPAQLNKLLVDDVFVPRAHPRLLVVLVAGLIATQLAQRGLGILQGRIANTVGSRLVGDLRSQLWGSLQRLSLGYFDKAQIGNLMSRVSQDTGRMQSFLTGSAQMFIVQVLQFFGVLAVMLAMNWRLTIVTLIPAPFMFVLSRFVWPYVRRMDRRVWQTMAKLNVVINDALSGVRVVKAFGQENREIARFDLANAELIDRNIVVSNMWTALGPLFSFVAGFGSLLIWYFGGEQILQGRMQLGTLFAFTAYLGMVLQPIAWGTQLVNDITASITSAERVFEVMDAEPDVREAEDPVPLPRIEGRVRFEGVEFGYTSHLPVLQQIDLDVRPGEMIGLVGHSGAGKSTLINLICRLYDAQVGSITVDGTDIRRLRQEDLRRQIGVVLQDTFLFDGTIAENIAYARPDADLWEVMQAAKIANAHEFILRQPDGYDTRVGERGQRLSGGERQRIAIARAILHDPRILILDEATASVDSQTERQIQEAIARLVKGRTTFAIAHRLSTLRSAHRLAVLDHGKIIELGTHEELMAKEGQYHKLVKAQQDAMATREVMVG